MDESESETDEPPKKVAVAACNLKPDAVSINQYKMPLMR
jgi:hypothetical protein